MLAGTFNITQVTLRYGGHAAWSSISPGFQIVAFGPFLTSLRPLTAEES